MPGNKKRLPILSSLPIPLRTISTSAPSNSQSWAISFMKVIFIAKKELAAYLVSSALFSSIKITGLPWRTKGAYKSLSIFFAFSDEVPITTLSGFIKSSTATPSRKNSGLLTISNVPSIPPLLSRVCFTFSAVPTGTVLLSMITL